MDSSDDDEDEDDDDEDDEDEDESEVDAGYSSGGQFSGIIPTQAHHLQQAQTR